MDILNDLIHQKDGAITANDYTYDDTYVTCCVRCVLCDEEIPVYSPYDRGVRVCERCKNAWSKMRHIIENSPKYATGVHINHVGRETIAKTPNYTEDKN